MLGQRLFKVVLLAGQALLLVAFGLNVMNQDRPGPTHLPCGVDIVVASLSAFDLGQDGQVLTPGYFSNKLLENWVLSVRDVELAHVPQILR